MSKYDKDADMYIPFEKSLRYPEDVQPDAKWSDVWANAFKDTASTLLGLKDLPLANMAFGVEVLRLAELCDLSYK